MASSLIPTLLLGLCANYPQSNITVTTVPPWKWVPEKHDNSKDGCILKTAQQLRQDILKGKKLKIATIPDQAPLSWVSSSHNNSYKGHGTAFQIVDTLSEKFGFIYDVLVPRKNTLLNEKGSIINMLLEGEADMVAAFVPVLPGMEDLVQWGVELSHFEYVVMMKRPQESATGSGLLAPFEMEVWFLILLSLIIIAPVIYGIMVLRSRLCGGSKVYSLSSCIWFVYGALMKQGSSLSPDNDSTRIMFGSWWLFIMILTAFYTANLTAFLTLSRFTLPIQSIEDIANPTYKWFAEDGGAIEYSVKMDNDLSVLRQSWRKGQGSFVNVSDYSRVKSLITSGVLFLHERNWLNFLMLGIERAITDEKKHCKFVLTTRTYLSKSLSFVFPKQSILPDLFNSDMLSYIESGIIKHLLTKDLPDAVICPLNLGSKERQLRNSDLCTTYAVVITGVSISIVVFIVELSSKILANRNPLQKQRTRFADYRNITKSTVIFPNHKMVKPLLNGSIIYVNGRD